MDLNFSWDFSTPEIYCLGALILIWIIEIIYQFYLFNRPFRVYQKEKKYRAIQGMGSVDDIFESIKSVISEL
jgi:purine-cytosine permease-like protein